MIAATALATRHVHAAGGHVHAAAAQAQHAAHPSFLLNGDAVIAGALCLVLLLWWAALQRANRCSDCGFCPIFCHCEHQSSGGRDHRL